jgi:hypothetical protein
MIHAAAITCLWYCVFGSRPVQVMLTRDTSATGCDLALVTTDTDASPAQLIERYAARLSIGPCPGSTVWAPLRFGGCYGV